MKSIKSILAVILLLSFAPVKAQIYLADNGLTASGSGTSTKVSLGGTLNNAATSVDFGSANSSSNFLFKKGSSNYFFIGNDGKIGVGTNSPGSSLDIVMASTSQPALTLKSIASQAASTYTFDLKDASGTRVVGIRPTDGLTYGDGVLTINARNKTNNFALLITDIGNGDAACRMIGASGGSLDLINFNYGHSPTWKYTNKHAKWMVNNNAFDGSSESYTFEHENQAPTVALMLLKGQASQTGDMLKVKNSSGIDLFRILSDGKGYFAGGVSIGTTVTDAAYKLWVEGSIRTRKVRVDQGAWPDYVFHHNYPLLPLSEVEKFIQQNNHLPEVPSAKEVEENGLDLGDNQATLLKKVEELTLYLIEQNKKIEQLQKEVDTLKKQK